MPSSAPEAVTEVDVGERMRDIRRSRRATLRTIADQAGVSESFLSQVERGRASASIASLRRIAGALGVSVADLFEPGGPPRPRVLRRFSICAEKYARKSSTEVVNSAGRGFPGSVLSPEMMASDHRLKVA